MATRRGIAGARALLLIDGTPVGWCTGVSAQENINQQPVEVLGEIDPTEIEAIGRSVSLTADFIRIKAESLRAQGYWPRGGTPDIVNFPAMTAELHDSVAGEVIAKIDGLKCQTINWRIDRGGLMTYNATFIGLRLYDEQDATT